ncbi:MAG: CPBP family intramembrane metalloprotease, partial [Clostridia bacterium]|nr:CPBP family intramembrane metalloprotease [Clostridia bacterium]
AVIKTGVIWGIWHAPMIALGHNYGFGYFGYPWTGVALMTLFCMGFGCFLSWLTLRTGSAVPAALAHAGLNAVAGLGLTVCLPGYDALLGPLPMGALGMLPALLAGALCCAALARGTGERRP